MPEFATSTSRSTAHHCPDCGGAVMRVLRTDNDKRRWDASQWRRYRCRNDRCNWQGLLAVVRHRRPSSRPPHGAAALRRVSRALLWLLLATGLGVAGVAALRLMLGL